MNRRLLKTFVALMMILLPVSMYAQSTVYVSTYAELSAAISNVSVNNIVVTANIDVPCETSGNAGANDLTGTSTAQLIINRSLTLQSQAGSKFIIKRTSTSGSASSTLKSIFAIRGNGHGINGTDNNTENTIEVSFTNIIIDGGANWGSSSVCERHNGSADAYGNAGRSMIDVYLGGVLNLEDGVEIRNGFTTKSDNSLLNDASTSQCFGGAVRVDYHNETGGGTVNIKAGAIIHDCATWGSNQGYGGALGAYNYARLNLYGGTISNCSSVHGGAIACTYRGAAGYGSNSAGIIRMYGGSISNCCATYGGAISMDGSVSNYLLGGTIENCSASSKGAAICIPEANTTVNLVAYTSNLLTITNCTGGNNTSTENTGGYQGVYKHENATIAETPVYHVTFQNNNTTFAVLSVAQGTSLGEAFPAGPVNANFRFVGWYNGNTQVTSTTTITGNITVTAKWDFLGSGTSADPYLIPTVDAWDSLASKVSASNTYSGKYFRQTGNFTITKMVGTAINANDGDDNNDVFHTFNGVYDGDGHTLNLNIDVTGERYVGPFHCVSNATIKNLIVTGSVQVHTNSNDVVSNRHPSALIGCCRTGSVVIENCLISANVSGADYMGGLFGHTWSANITITGCVYSGTLNANGSNYTGGFIGWGGDFGHCSYNLTNNLFTGSYSGSGKFHPVGILSTLTNNTRTVTNTYYTAGLKNMVDNDGQSLVNSLSYKGERVYSVTAGTGVTVAAAGDPTPTYDVSELDFYGTNGLAFNGVRYGAQGDAVSLNLSGAEHYAATTGTLSGSANPYTLTMTAANSEIVLPVASVTSGENTTYYATISSAVSAWVNNSTLTLLADVTTTSTILVSNTSMLDLNGHGIKMTGSGSVIRVASGKTLTLNDSDPTTTHKFSVNNSTLLATLNEASGTLTINGGYITGGYAQYGCAIDCSVNNDAHCVMNGGTLIGNTSLGINGDSQGVVCVSRDSQHYHNSFTMNGGAICYNYSRGLSILPEGYGVVNGGTIHHNKSVGIDMWEPYGLTLNNAVIMYNEDGGVGMDTYHTLLQIQGRTIITDNTKNGNPADICYNSGGTRSQALAISGALDSETRIGIYYNTNNVTPGVFTSGLDGRGDASNFFSNLSGYGVKINGNGEALLAVLATITSAPTAETELVYNGSAQTLVNAGTAEGGTMKYSLDNSSWSTSIPTATNAGNYTVYYMVEGDATHADFTPSPNTVEVYIDYTITYDLDGGSVASANPSHYNVTTATFTLNNPTKTDYTFTGWTGTDLNEPTMSVTIDNGSTGHRTFTATFAIDEYRIDSIPLTWQVKIGNEEPIEPTPYVTNPTATDTLGYVMIPVGSEFVIIPSEDQKHLVSKMELIGPILDLSKVTTDTIVPDGWTVTGTLGTNVKVSIANGATVTLDNAVIQPVGNLSPNQSWAGITCLGNATIVLKDGTENTVKSFGMMDGYPGIRVLRVATLTIEGNTGKLSVTGSNYSAGIGYGNIVINGGTVNATAPYMGSGIGCDYSSSCGNITINGGTVNANGGSSGAGIGSIYGMTCGIITINGGTVNASGDHDPGIGSGDAGHCGNITINGGTVTAHSDYGAAIGGYDCGDITITSGVTQVTATSNGDYQCIGKSYDSSSTCGTVTIGNTVGGINAWLYTYPAPTPAGPLDGKFSVSDTKKVFFSPGNLQATYNGTSWSWNFASNDYVYIGNAAGNTLVTYAEPWINGTGTVDLFGNSTVNNFYGINSSITDVSESTYTGDFVDWGTLTIGSDVPNTWYTLSNAEWEYLFETRTDYNLKSGAATVAGVHGWILIPDNWMVPDGLIFNSGYKYSFGWDYNIYTAAQWETMKASGVVFLPAAGYRHGASMESVESTCYYRCNYGTVFPCCAHCDKDFTPSVGSMAGDWNNGESVRLVRNAN